MISLSKRDPNSGVFTGGRSAIHPSEVGSRCQELHNIVSISIFTAEFENKYCWKLKVNEFMLVALVLGLLSLATIAVIIYCRRVIEKKN